MALETATYINGLVPTNPLGSDPLADADGHLRLIKSTLKTTFPNITGAVTSTQAQLNSPFPPGGIIMWSGAISAVPAGWALCDGTNGTPNLRDRFVVGAGSTYAVGATGGVNTVTLDATQIPSHTHTVSATTSSAGDHSHGVSDPGHSHSLANVVGNYGYGSQFGVRGDYAVPPANSLTSTGGSGTGISIQGAGSHTHTINTTSAAAGGGLAHENRPPYYALAYIMKV